MYRLLMPLVIIGIALGVFFMFANPIYTDIGLLRTQIATYDEALNNSKALENERDKLTAKYNSIDPTNLEKLEKLLPENVDNIRLILEIGQIATPYGMVLRNVKYNTQSDSTNSSATQVEGIQAGGVITRSDNKEYGVWDLAFSTTGSYANFLNFLRDLQKNLRIVDIASIEFTSTGGENSSSADVYTYDFKIKTYWLKN